MYSACARQSEMMDSPSQFMPPAGLVIDENFGSYDFHPATAKRLLGRKTMCELFGHIGNNPKLIDELASRKNRNERIDLLINHKLIASADDFPAGKEVKQKKRPAVALSGKADEREESAKGACSFIAFGGSYES